MADQGIVERLRDWPREMPLTSSVACDAADHIEKADKLMLLAHRNIEALEASREMSSETITELRAEVARLTEGAIEGWVIPIEHEHPLLKEWLVSSHPVTGLGEREQRPCKLIIDTQGEDE